MTMNESLPALLPLERYEQDNDPLLLTKKNVRVHRRMNSFSFPG